jgi:hypothetical protein
VIIKKETILAGDQTQFNVLLRTHYVGTNDTVTREISIPERAAIARAIQSKTIVLDWAAPDADLLLADIDKKFGAQTALFKAEVRFTLDALQYFAQSLQLNAELNATVHKMNTILVAHAIADAQFWWQERPSKKMVNFLCEQMQGWDSGFGHVSQGLQALFVQTIEKFFAVPVQDNEAVNLFYQTVLTDFHHLMDKFARLANRLKETEIGGMKANKCKAVVARFLNKTIDGQKLPPYISKFLHSKYINEMQMLLIKHGEDSALWLRWRKLVETLVKFYQEGSLVEGDTVSRNIMLNIANEIEQLTEESHIASNAFEDFCNEIAYDFSQKAIGKSIDGLALVSPMETTEESAGPDTKIAPALINKAKAFDVGQWFIYKDESGKEIRCKWLFAMPEHNQIFFVNLLGQKALNLTYEKFSQLLTAKYMLAIRQGDYLQHTLNALVEKLLENFNALYEAKQSLRKQKELDAIQNKEENEKRQAAEKAKAEAELIAKRKAAEAEEAAQRKKAEEQTRMFAKITDDLKRQARLAINSLALGSWVDLLDAETQTFKRIKLAVKYNATGRFVFVDADGATVTDCLRDDLVELMLKRQLKLLESDGQFADRLAQIVKNIRQVE